MSNSSLQPLLDPKSIVFVGASSDPNRTSGIALHSTIRSGFGGPIFAVNPNRNEIAGVPCVPRVSDLPQAVDVAVLSVAQPAVFPTLVECRAAGIRSAVVFAAGYAEVGDEEGARRQEELVSFSRASNMPVAGPNSLGIVNFSTGAHLSFTSLDVKPGGLGQVALISQSGAMGSAICRQLTRVDVGCRYVISTGNEASVDIGQYLSFMADDDHVRTVLCYIESIRNGEQFMSAARRLRERGKLLALVKSGRIERGADAARSHTAALVGDDAIYDAAFDAVGAIRVEDISELTDIAYLHRAGKAPRRNAVGIFTVSGAVGVLLADGFTEKGTDVPVLPEGEQAAMAAAIGPDGSPVNPVDTTMNIANDMSAWTKALAVLERSVACDVVVVGAIGSFLSKAIEPTRAALIGSDKLAIVIDSHDMGVRSEVEAAGLLYFNNIGRMVRATSAYLAWHTMQPLQQSARPQSDHAEAVAAIVTDAHARNVQTLSETEGKQLLALLGMPGVPETVAGTAEEALVAAKSFGFPVVLKIVSPDIAHKTEAGGVVIGVSSDAAVLETYDAILRSVGKYDPNARIDGVSVQPQLTPVAELIVGFRRDQIFGWLLTIGLGGTWAELFRDTVTTVLPLRGEGSVALLRELKSFPLLDGYRGRPKADIAAIADCIDRVAAAVIGSGEGIEELEVNPLMALAGGQKVAAADALVRVKQAGGV